MKISEDDFYKVDKRLVKVIAFLSQKFKIIKLFSSVLEIQKTKTFGIPF